jgi:hypothetical protein
MKSSVILPRSTGFLLSASHCIAVFEARPMRVMPLLGTFEMADDFSCAPGG